MLIKVLQKHINNASSIDVFNCPVARAINEQLINHPIYKKCWVDVYNMGLICKEGCKLIPLPREVTEYIHKTFDLNTCPEFSFELNI